MRAPQSGRRFVGVAAFVMMMLAASFLGCRSSSSRSDRDVCVFVEAEAFDELGGWVLDQQFMDLMGSPYVLAHGMGRPVEDAVTEVHFPHAGMWNVFVRTRDWVAPWNAPGAPGRFQVLVDGNPLDATFGIEGADWHWQAGGAIDVSSTDVRVALHDLTGFEGRCDALVFSDDASWSPPDDPEALASFRRTRLGFDAEPADGGQFDFVVVGGGMAGSAAAITAARRGLRTALVQDRPVLGGNASSEVRVWPEGHVNQMPWPAVGDVVMELVPDRNSDSRNAQGAHVFDDDRKLRVARAEPLLTLFLEHRMNGTDVEDAHIRSIMCQDVRSGRRVRIRGALFADCTGDGCLGALAGADFEQTDRGHMGASNLWNIQCLCEDEDPLASELAAACEDAAFPPCPWAVDLRDKPFPGRTQGKTVPEAGTQPISLGNWYWENGFDRDPIRDMERIRDQNFRAMYGAWDAIKNVEKRYPAHRLGWVAYIAGKRESRRLLGDVILTGEDLRDGRVFEDGCVPCTWGIDTHHPDPKYAQGHDGDEFIADYTHGEGYVYEGPYWVPYRCLYSRNVDNLFMAGRDISVTHEALGAVRVMKTTGAMGEIVGMVAAICTRAVCSPREVYEGHLGELHDAMRAGAGRWTMHEEHDRTIELSASSARVRGPSLRYEAERDCLGYWRSDAAWPEWALRTNAPAEWRITIELACTKEEAGASYAVRIGEHELRAFVPETGAWDRWQTIVVGTVHLPAGEHRLTVRGQKEAGPLMKLRRVTVTRR